MDSAVILIPQISISPAPLQEPVVEPRSPFSATLATPSDDDAFRPIHLTPPPTLPNFSKTRSPLRFSNQDEPAHGLDRGQFEALLQASRERTCAKKENDLRREAALKAHNNKQLERRAHFLSKIFAPPSPTAALTPKTPPDSPAIFHYSLPSPGLVSPLSMFDSISKDPVCDSSPSAREPWIEQVDFRAPRLDKNEHCNSVQKSTRRTLPSLAQISARLSSQGYIRTRDDRSHHAINAQQERPRLHIGVGRLQMPVRTTKLAPLLIPSHQHSALTVIDPLSRVVSSTKPSEPDLAPDSRGCRAHNMLATIRRRTLALESQSGGAESDGTDDRKSKWKRNSAPADLMPLHQRSGFEHPVLALPGGF